MATANLKTGTEVAGNTSRHRMFCYTDFTEKPIELEKGITYICEGKEICPTTKKSHIQGCIYFDNPQRLSGLIEKYPGKHWEVCKGTIEQNVAYCKKEGNFTEKGEKPKQGKRSDLVAAITTLKNSGMLEVMKNHSDVYVKFHKGLEKLQFGLKAQDVKHEAKEVMVLIGRPGTGKTRWAYENYPDLYSKSSGMWWDGYNGEETVLIDDYEGHIPYFEILKITDRYPYKVQCKGGFLHLTAKRIIFTSNMEVRSWYQGEDCSALLRRITFDKRFCEE